MLSALKLLFTKIPFLKIANITIYIFSFIIALFVTVTSYIYYIDITDMSWEQDNSLLLLVVFFLAVLFLGIISFGINRTKKSQKINFILFAVVFLFIMGASVWWIVNARSLAQNDALSLYEIAMRIIKEQDYSMITSRDSYMALWPFQSGILLYYEMILRIISDYNVVPMECLNWIFLGLGLLSGYFLTKKWFMEDCTITCWSILLLFCWPWFFYVNFAYGEMPSICLMIFATWMLTDYLEHSKWWYLILALLGIGFGVLLRKNMMIYVVAAVLILIVLCFHQFKKRYLCAIIGLLLITSLSNVLPQRIYELRANDTMGSGVSAYGYIAMGLQDTEGISPGWNNGYHSKTLIENQYNIEVANEIYKKSIQDSLSYMWEHPDYACNFFFEKLVPEWCDENFSCLYSTSLVYYERTDAAWKIYAGDWTNAVLQVMNVYQSILYSGFLLFCIQSIIELFQKKEASWKILWRLVFMVTIIGGFIFYMFWEGGSRYTLPYMVCMLPYSAAGISRLIPYRNVK